MKKTIFLLSLILLPGCIGVSKTEIQSVSPIMSTLCSTSYQATYRCFLDQFPNDEITVKDIFSEEGLAELYISAMQFSQQRYYYRISFRKKEEGSLASLQRSFWPHGRISPEEIWEVVQKCGCR